MASEAVAYPLHPLAIIIPILTGLVVLIDIPPLWWHLCHHNVGAGCLIFQLVVLNLAGFVNSLIWPRDNVQDWYDGDIFCDIEVRVHLFASFGIGASLICIFKSLADVLDTSKTMVSMSRDSRRKKMVLDLVLCIGTPSLFILVYYVVQSQRYAIEGISGCAYVWDGTWVGILLCQMWFSLLQVIAGIYAGLVIFRLVRYSRMFSTMLRNHSSTKSRFYRTFIMSLFLIVCNLPAMLYNFVRSFPLLGSYSWNYTHSDWNMIYKSPSFGHVNPDIWSSLAGGVMVFIFFGTGQEALKMYRGWLVVIGLGKVWPSLLQEPSRRLLYSENKWSFLETRAKKMFGKRVSTDYTDASSHTAVSYGDPELALPPPTRMYPSTSLPVADFQDIPLHDMETFASLRVTPTKPMLTKLWPIVSSSSAPSVSDDVPLSPSSSERP